MEVLGERIESHHRTLCRHMKMNERQHGELKLDIAAMSAKISEGLKHAHGRIDRIWIGIATALSVLASSLVGALLYVLYEGPPWQ